MAAETAAVTVASERAAAAQRVRESAAASPPAASLGTLFEGWLHTVLAAPGDALLSHALYPLAAAASAAADAVRSGVAASTRRAAAAFGVGVMRVVVLVRATITASAAALALAASAAAAAFALRAAVRCAAWRRRGRGFVRGRGWLAIPPKLPLDAVSLARAAAVPAPGEAAGRPLGTAAAAAADALQTADALQSWIVGRFWQAWRVLIWLACGGLLKPAVRADTKGTLHNPTSPSTNPTARPLLDKFFRCAGRISAPWFGARRHEDPTWTWGRGRKRLQVRTNRA